MGPANTREGSGIMMVSRPQSDYDELKPFLETMTGKLIVSRRRSDSRRGVQAVRQHVHRHAQRPASATSSGSPVRSASRRRTRTACSTSSTPRTAVAPRAKKIASGDFAPTWELTMARKDTRLMIDEAQSHGVTLAHPAGDCRRVRRRDRARLRFARFDRRREAGRPRMIRYISEADVASCLTVPVAIDLLEQAARDLAAGNASVAPRQRITSGSDADEPARRRRGRPHRAQVLSDQTSARRELLGDALRQRRRRCSR